MVNKVIVIGNLTRDPEVKALASGTSVAEVSLALNRKYSQGGEKKEETTFIDITFWGKQAEIVGQYAKKGRQLYVEGRLTQDSWTDADNNKRTKLKVTAEDFQFLGGGEGKTEGKAQAAQKPQSGKASQPAVVDVEDEDVPF